MVCVLCSQDLKAEGCSEFSKAVLERLYLCNKNGQKHDFVVYYIYFYWLPSFLIAFKINNHDFFF